MAAPGSCSRGASALPTISPRSCSAAFGTIAPDSSLVMSSRFAMKRLSRSDSSMIVASRSAFSASLSFPPRSRSVPAAPRLRERRLEVVRDRGQQRGAQRSVSTVRLTRSMSSTRWTRSIASAALIDQRVEQAALDPASAAAPACRCRCRRRRSRRARCASAGTAAWRPAACPSRARPGDRSPRPISRRRDRPRRACPPADSRPSRRSSRSPAAAARRAP